MNWINSFMVSWFKHSYIPNSLSIQFAIFHDEDSPFSSLLSKVLNLKMTCYQKYVHKIGNNIQNGEK